MGPIGRSLPKNHPWYGFVSERTEASETEALQRTLRYAGIDINKFWVELQSVPIFMKSLSGASLSEVERVVNWVGNSAAFAESVDAPHLIPALAQPESRKRVLDFARDVLSIQAKREEVLARLNRPPVAAGENTGALLEPVAEAARIVASTPGLGSRTMRDLSQEIRDEGVRLEQVRLLRTFFAWLSRESGMPLPSCAEEGARALKSLERLAKIPPTVLAWRGTRVLEPSQKVKIEAWQNRTRPILELRQRLALHFQLESEVPTPTLRSLAETLRAEGLLSGFQAIHRQARRAYRTLLRDQKAQRRSARENGHQASERVLDWIKYREHAAAFETQAEARALFGADFKGIDTDFVGALEANLWAERARYDVAYSGSGLRDDAYAPALFDFLTRIAPDRIEAALAILRDEDGVHARRILDGEGQAGSQCLVPYEIPFADLEATSKARLEGLVQLKDHLHKILPRGNLRLQELVTMGETLAELRGLAERMDADPDLRSALGPTYAGPETDLRPIDRAAGYVKQVRAAHLSDALSAILLSAHGPQRLADSRELAKRCLIALAVVREHYARIEAATHGEVRVLSQGLSLESTSIEALSERIQNALRRKETLEEAMSSIRYAAMEREVGLDAKR